MPASGVVYRRHQCIGTACVSGLVVHVVHQFVGGRLWRGEDCGCICVFTCCATSRQIEEHNPKLCLYGPYSFQTSPIYKSAWSSTKQVISARIQCCTVVIRSVKTSIAQKPCDSGNFVMKCIALYSNRAFPCWH